MPNYEFECQKCKKRYELFLTVKEFEDGCHNCPGCGEKGKNVLYAPAVHMRLSLMHPRHMRGQKGKPVEQKGVILKDS